MYPDSVLFDLDGTLLDTAPDFILVLNALRQEYQLEPLPEQQIRNTVSNGARALVELGFNLAEGEGKFEVYREKLLKNYQAQSGKSCRLFPGMGSLLTQLEENNIPWGIVTNKPSRFTLPLLDVLQLSHRCGAVVCADQVDNPKPHPEPLLKACEMLNVSPEKSIYIGDHQRDIEAGRKAKMNTIAALFGYIPENENPDEWQADFHADTVEAIQLHLFSA